MNVSAVGAAKPSLPPFTRPKNAPSSSPFGCSGIPLSGPSEPSAASIMNPFVIMLRPVKWMPFCRRVRGFV